MNTNTSWGTTEGVYKAIIVVAAILSVFLLALSIKGFKSLGKSSDPIMTSISVQGEGEIVAIPDVATFSFSVEETAKTVDAAQKAAAAKNEAALKAVRDGGVEDKDIKTTGYNIYPKYENEQNVCNQFSCNPGRSVLVGYTVSQSTQIKVRDLDKAGAIFESIGKTGVDNVNGLTFSIDSPEGLKDKAREMAIVDAKARAEALAETLGVKLVRITGYYEEMPYAPYYDRAMGGAEMGVSIKASNAPTISTGEQKVTTKVSVMYEIR